MQSMINLLAHIGANAENIDACVVACIMKPQEGQADPQVEVMTIGENAVRLFGISEFIRHEIYQQLEGKP